MTNLLNAAYVLAVDQVEVVKVQMADLARTWWLAEEERLRFYESFYERFFPKTARREMAQQFINLRQWSRMVDEYAAEFLRLSRFAPHMVAEDEDPAN